MVGQRRPLVYSRPRDVNQLPNLPITNSAAATYGAAGHGQLVVTTDGGCE